ncbi:MAG TPA: RagB/SusD family nutrient uptake outer membrane protein [Puia sp.]|nr:RagB/SusD family nutrient uptake outer membrane protein [Puia sp.]
MRFKIIFLNVFTAVIIVYSCNKNNLNQPALGLLDDAAIANKNGVRGLLIGAYALWDGVSEDGPQSVGGYYSGASNWIYGSVCGSEAYGGSAQPDQPPITEIETFHATGAMIGPLDDKWRALYAGIARANTVLRVMRQVKDMTTSDTTEIRAEAVFLRAWYHFEAVKIWNKVPFVDETVLYDAGNYYLNNDTLIWPAIENDFQYAINNLPPTQPAVGRANKWAAKAYLAKVYMFEHRYAEAKLLLEDLIAHGVTAGGLPYALRNYADNFNAEFKNKNEAVFSVQMSVNDGAQGSNGNIGDIMNYPYGAGPSPNCCGFFQPSQWLVNHFKTDAATGLPDPDHFNDVDVTNDEGIGSNQHFTPYAGTLDPRLDWTVGRRGVPYLDWGPHPGKLWVRDQPFGGPYAPIKNIFYQSQVGHFSDLSYWADGPTANNVNLIRFSDILLLAAEAEVETGGDLNKAQEYVNWIRARAADSLGWVKNDNNIPFAIKVTNSPVEFAAIDDTSFKKIQPLDWVVRKDLNQTWVALIVNKDGTKIWNAYSVPRYNIQLYKDPWTDKESALKSIRYERVLELAMEGHRFFDLVRWGIAEQEISSYLQKEQLSRSYMNGAVFTKGKNEYFPIPQAQIDLSVDAHGVQHMHQNPGY